MKGKLRKIGIIAAACLAAGATMLVYATFRIEKAAGGRVHEDVMDLPHRDVGIVLGCSPTVAAGRKNLYFEYRMDAAARLFHSGKVSRLLVSGDNHTRGYDEPEAMRKALISRGVPDNRIVSDYAGFSTFESIVRAQKIFGLKSACVVSQKAHTMRAIYLGSRTGLDLVAYPAKDLTATAGLRTNLRESLARVRALWDTGLFSRHPRFLGPPVPIGT